MNILHEINVERVCNAEVVNTPLGIGYCDEYPDSPPVLTIFTDRKANGEYRYEDAYELLEVPTIGEQNGRTFSLTKTVKAKNGLYTLATQEAPYTCFIDRDQQQHNCTCNGFKFTKTCKHVDSLKKIVSEFESLEETPAMSHEHTPEYVAEDLQESDPFAGVSLTPHDECFSDVPF